MGYVQCDHSNVMQRTNLNTATSLAWGNWLRDSLVRRLLCTTLPVCCFLTPVFSRSVVLNPAGEKLSSCYCRSDLNRCGSTKNASANRLAWTKGISYEPGTNMISVRTCSKVTVSGLVQLWDLLFDQQAGNQINQTPGRWARWKSHFHLGVIKTPWNYQKTMIWCPLRILVPSHFLLVRLPS